MMVTHPLCIKCGADYQRWRIARSIVPKVYTSESIHIDSDDELKKSKHDCEYDRCRNNQDKIDMWLRHIKKEEPRPDGSKKVHTMKAFNLTEEEASRIVRDRYKSHYGVSPPRKKSE